MQDARHHSMATHRITLSPSTIVCVLACVAAFLVLASVAGQWTKSLAGPTRADLLIALFNIDEEGTIPSYFSASLLFFAAVLLAAIAWLKRNVRAPFAAGWTFLSFAFLCMAIDEAAGIHDVLVDRLTRRLLGEPTLSVFYFAWVIPGIATVLVFSIVFFKFFLHLPRATRVVVLRAAALFIGGAVGVELIEGYYATSHGHENLTFNMIATVQESMEMAGVIVFLYALLQFIQTHYGEVRIRLEGAAQGSGPVHED